MSGFIWLLAEGDPHKMAAARRMNMDDATFAIEQILKRLSKQ